jgi:lysophospholipase L1-like esterase
VFEPLKTFRKMAYLKPGIVVIIFLMTACQRPVKIFTIHTIGDSTMADKKPEVFPETGWCQAFPQLLVPGVTLRNHAVNGRSTKSFIDEGRWKNVTDSLKAGDYVWIQFGHNDQKIQDSARYTEPRGRYLENLERFVNETLEKGATPVLFTSIVRRRFDESGHPADTHGEYPDVVRRLAAGRNVTLIDLQQITEKLLMETGMEESKKIYLWTAPDERYPEGRKDDTHLSEEGAETVARLVAEDLKNMKHPLAAYLK